MLRKAQDPRVQYIDVYFTIILQQLGGTLNVGKK